MRVLPILVVTLSVLAAPLQQVLADQQSTAKDVSIIVVPRPDVRREIGNVKVTFSDGHTEVLTHTGDCYDAKLSPKGNVGWIRVGKGERAKNSVVVRLPDGATKNFPPFGENVFISDWRLADDGKTLIIKSMGHHGPSSYAQYDLASGKVIDSRGPGYTPYAKLPPWAKLVADPVADE
jgi:hypothetical protein